MDQLLIKILENLRNENPDTIVDLLEISSDELVDCFLDKIEEKWEYLCNQYESF